MSQAALDTPIDPPAAAPGSRWKAWAGRVDAFTEWASDCLNPLVVKETRQALKSRQFTLWFLLLLVGCWVVTIGGVALLGPGVRYGAAGGVLFSAYYCVLLFPLLVVAPFAAFRSVAAEQDENTRDLLTVSTLSPAQVVQGKLASAAVQVGIYFSALAPCLAFTYLLRGVDVMTIVMLLAYAVLNSLGLSMVGIFLASAFRQKFSQVFISIILIGILFSNFWGGSVLGASLVQFGGMVPEEGLGTMIAYSATTFATSFAILYFGAVALNSFPSSNRSTALRVAASVQHAFYLGWMVCLWGASGMDDDVAQAMGVLACCYWWIGGAMLTSESPVLSSRVRRSLPTTGLGRTFGAWLTPGPGTGYFFVLSNLAIVMATALGMMLYHSQSVDIYTIVMLLVAISYVAAYLGVGKLLIGLARAVTPVTAGACVLIHLLLLLAGSAAPFLIQINMQSLRYLDYSFLQLTNPFWTVGGMGAGAISDDELIVVVAAVGSAAACAVLLNIRPTWRELHQGAAATPERVLAELAALNPAPAEAPKSPWDEPAPG
ncbi:hypothetical protein [Pirellulimonas nuda]|uniref:hypothetical protein n=1 Tax=Pirellulimonas nuda TaxID=2528009 RepID=UPI0011AAE15D|nr:hypothetical protein [Pirellulimonas nuda]